MKKSLLLLVLCCSSIVFSQKKSKVLLTIDGEKTTISDFKRVYEKNLDAIENEESKDVEKNLELYINYKLKVKEAYSLKLDTLPSYIKEMETYQNQLSAPYMQDTVFINKLVKIAYFRTKNEVKAKHILVQTPKLATPKDTLLAYQKIIEIRKRVLDGEDFEKVANEISEDPSARNDAKSGRKGNNGNLGYFSAFKMLYRFEDVAYTTEKGKVSEPFRTRYGYHILKVDTLRVSKGEVEVAHILLKDKGAKGEALINVVYKKLQADEQFKALVRKYSDDVGTKSKGGKLKRFGSGVMVDSFEEVAFSLQKEGEYSKPFKTRFGWHILQLTKKHPVLPFVDLERELKNKVRSGDRTQLSIDAVINKLKKKYSISENNEAKKIFDRKDFLTTSKDSMQAVILSINDKNIKQVAFFSFLKNKRNKPVFEVFKQFKDQEILAYYKENLEKTEPEFAHILQEYRDGLLLFELMQQKIWEKSSKDTLGLKNFFNANLSTYHPKELNKIKGEVMNDYQNFLDKNWIADLRRKSVIEIKGKQLKKLIKSYSNK
jgi:peptidyl-prolyl cis-trans isomerase SurA